jgi:hypothetical protein
MIDVLRAQLLSAKAQIEATLAVLDSIHVEEPLPATCLHPETENVGTFGAPQIKCTTCGAIVPSPG